MYISEHDYENNRIHSNLPKIKPHFEIKEYINLDEFFSNYLKESGLKNKIVLEQGTRYRDKKESVITEHAHTNYSRNELMPRLAKTRNELVDRKLLHIQII